MNGLLTHALHYLNQGYSIIPVNPNVEDEEQYKHPYVKWARYQEHRPNEAEVKEWLQKWDKAMIGTVTGRVSGLFMLDVDSEEGKQDVAPYLPENLETPTVKSPRGTHTYFKYEDGLPTRSAIFGRPGVDIRGEGGYAILPPSRNSAGGGYEWLIGPNDAELLPVPERLRTHILNIYSLNALGCSQGADFCDSQNSKTSQKLTINLLKGNRNDSMFSVAFSLYKGGMDTDNVLYLLTELNKSCVPPLSFSEIKAICKSADERFKRRERKIYSEVRDFISVSPGEFSVSSLYASVSFVSKEEKAAARQALVALCKEGIIERVGSRAGWYRSVNQSIEVMDFLNAPTTEFSATLPLDVSTLCKLYPGNIVIVAGAKSAGKTAYLLNLAKLNIAKWPIDFLNSEMGETELRLRLEAHTDTPLQKWAQGVRFISRGREWWDVIQPENRITIIDYMEPPEDQIYLVGSFIRKIHEKMQGKGVCIIGLQKDPKRDTGRGASFSMDKARLYLALDYNQEKHCNSIKIVDAKAWRKSNPRGLVREYKLHNGANYQPVSNWHI